MTEWTDTDLFEPTAILRFAVPPHTTTQPPTLQQRWRKPTLNPFGHVNGWEYEWRDVPREVVAVGVSPNPTKDGK